VFLEEGLEVGHGHDEGLDVFAVLEISLWQFVFGGVQIDLDIGGGKQFGAEAGGTGGVGADMEQFATVASLFLQFAKSGGRRRFAGVNQAGGESDAVASQGRAELANQQDAVLRDGPGDDDDGVRRVLASHGLPGALCALGVAVVQEFQTEEFACAEDFSTGQFWFHWRLAFCLRHCVSRICPAVPGLS